ncbi:similar to Urinary protein 2 precursor (RUP-2) (predicted) [Rattus norvegicus]|uniref:Prostate and testis expressed 14 like 1 n=3 Tax=Rattus norvegicus TaxID=10116 RepID=M0R8V1_RAT|nr:similar to Urinary protein 2 precursor (RUP-2) (predicted) [Rattus norvegicus]|eukprot:XP_006242893.2 PREDICTED: secreted seminal-vesicle Ly-6 protein 1 [Rattus norvegicus]
MGKHILLLLLGLCLLVNSLQALTCVTCERFNSQGICERGEGCCQAKPGQKCASLITYRDGKFLLGSQRCADVCFKGTVENGGLTAKMKCCSKSFCNTVNI